MKMQSFVRLLARGTSNFVRLPCHEHVKTFVPVVRVPARLLGRNQTNQSCLPSCWINLTKPQSSTIPVLRLAHFSFLFSEYYSLLVALFVFFALFSLRVSFSLSCETRSALPLRILYVYRLLVLFSSPSFLLCCCFSLLGTCPGKKRIHMTKTRRLPNPELSSTSWRCDYSNEIRASFVAPLFFALILLFILLFLVSKDANTNGVVLFLWLILF